jgi:hypothetical protein
MPATPPPRMMTFCAMLFSSSLPHKIVTLAPDSAGSPLLLFPANEMIAWLGTDDSF